MELDLLADDELLIELTAMDPPSIELEGDRVTCWGGVGSEIRVLRGPVVLYSTVGRPVPDVPPQLSVREFMDVAGLRGRREPKKPRPS